MKPQEIRAIVKSYHAIKQVGENDAASYFRGVLSEIQDDCAVYAAANPIGRWSRGIIGDVLSAGLVASVSASNAPPNPTGMLRAFGLAGERPMSSLAAWRLVQPYAFEPSLSPKVLEQIQRSGPLRISRLPANPSPVDVLEDLTRPRTAPFCAAMGRWLMEWFRVHITDDDEYGAHSRRLFDTLIQMNDSGDLAHEVWSSAPRATPSREDWKEILRGRFPLKQLEMRAAIATTRQFIADYWLKLNQEAPKAAVDA